MKLRVEYLDLETAPLPLDQLQRMMPEFTAPKAWKDEEKIAANLAEQREAWIEKAALDPQTGQVLVAIWTGADGAVDILDADAIGEKAVLEAVCRTLSDAGQGANYKVGGWNIRSFDLPFLVKRCWHHEVALPTGLMQVRGKWADPAPWIFDLRDLWTLGEAHGGGTLGDVAQFLGVGSKQSSGKDFHLKWRSPTEHADAFAYAMNDGKLPKLITERLLALSPDGYGLRIRADNQRQPKHNDDTRTQGLPDQDDSPDLAQEDRGLARKSPGRDPWDA